MLCKGQDDDEALHTLNSLAMQLEDDSLSTAFSGVRAPETGMAIMRFRLEKRLGRTISHNTKASHMIEWNAASQEECKLAGSVEGSCVFGDIGQFFRPELHQQVIPELLRKPAVAIQALTPLIMTDRAMCTTGKCQVHDRMCSLKSCNRHIAGTSCKPFSRRGAGLGTADSDIVYTLAWVGLRRVLQESDITQENVVGFPMTLFSDLLGDLYHLDSCTLQAACFGSPCSRNRQFVRLRHKIKVLAEISPISNFALRFHRVANFHWSQPLVRY